MASYISKLNKVQNYYKRNKVVCEQMLNLLSPECQKNKRVTHITMLFRELNGGEIVSLKNGISNHLNEQLSVMTKKLDGAFSLDNLTADEMVKEIEKYISKCEYFSRTPERMQLHE